MKRLTLTILVLATASVAPAAFVPPVPPVAEPYTDASCLENCHGVPGQGALSVDGSAFGRSVHAEADLGCVDCHEDASPNEHPAGGYDPVDCRDCHDEKGEAWAGTLHGKLWATGWPGAPYCSNCHTTHGVRRPSDPASTVHRANLAKTCGSCHGEKVAAASLAGWFTRFRIGAHGKGDLAERYDVTECLSCHQGAAAHGEPTVTGQACPSCHRPQGKKSVGNTTFHVDPTNPAQGWPRVARCLNGSLLALLGLGALAGALWLGYVQLYKGKGDEEES